MTRDAYIVDAIRTPIGRLGGSLAEVRTDDLASLPISELLKRNPLPAEDIDDVLMGCANQAGEDNRNVARMAALLAGLPVSVPGVTVNRLCGSGLQAVADAARQIACGESDLLVAGGVEHMTRSPLVMAKTAMPWARGNQTLFDTMLGWRFVNPKMTQMHETIGLGQTAERVAEKKNVSREEQDLLAFESQNKAAKALASGRFDCETFSVTLKPAKDGTARSFDKDEHPRPGTKLEKLQSLRPVFKEGGTVTAGNSSGLNDGAAALLLASEEAVKRYNLKPLARYVTSAARGVEVSYMGLGPIPATQKAYKQSGLSSKDIDFAEVNEAFAAQAVPCLKELELDPAKVNVNGGAIALGHPLGMSGARMVGTLVHELQIQKARYGLATMCIGVGQGIAMIVERI